MLDFGYDAAQVPPGRIALDDNSPTHVFPIDRVRPAGINHIGHGDQGNLAAARQYQGHPLQLLRIIAERIVQPHQQIELPLPHHKLRDHPAVHGRLDQFIHVGRVQAVGGQRLSVQVDAQLRDFDLLLDHQVFHAGHPLDRRLHFVRFDPQHIQIIAVELDPDLGLHAGKHCPDDVLQGLFRRNDRAGNLSQFLAHVGHDFLAAAAQVRIEADDDFRHIHALGVLVEFGPARATPEGNHATDFLQTVFDHAGDPVGGLQGIARRQYDVDLHAAFVERRQEIAAQLRDHHES